MQIAAGAIPPRDAAYVIAALEKANSTLVAGFVFRDIALALKAHAPLVTPFLKAWKFRTPKIGAPRPTGEDLAQMLVTFAWLADVPAERDMLRNVLILRSMKIPTSGAPLPWTRIGRALGLTGSASNITKTAQTYHARAVAYIVDSLNSF